MTTSDITLYGIPNCDTVKKARTWLTDNGIAYRFHDFRKDGLDAATVKGWIATLGLDTVLNRKGTTWRQLPEAVRNNISDDNAIALLVEQPTLIKRPVLVRGKALKCGFKADEYATILK
ncbi:MAG: ArsC family reductase [Gammaproteobacteria bacterium]